MTEKAHEHRVHGGTSSRRVWLASYPRSGNTYLRCILHGCFGLPSTTVYGPGDLGRNAALERYAGHFNASSPPPELTYDMPWLTKTHRYPTDGAPAIYVVRDPRAVSVSLWEFQRKRRPLRAIITGATAFGTWSSHVAAWQPLVRANTLLLRYEDMVENLPAVLERLSRFFDLPAISREAPNRTEIAAIDGRWVREPSDWRQKIAARDLRLLEAVNGEMLSMLGYDRYSDGHPVSAKSNRSAWSERPTYDHAWARLKTSCTIAYWRLRRGVRRRRGRLTPLLPR